MTPELVRKLRERLGPGGVLSEPEEMLTYECDSLTIQRVRPDVVTFPRGAEDVQAIVRLCLEAGIPFTPRGAGTGISGGALPASGGVLVECARMNRVLELNYDDRYAVVEPGVVNLDLSKKTEKDGFHYAPDPSSQASCTLGGNVAENSGGPHCLKYGVTVNHVLGVEIVFGTGELLTIGGPEEGLPGPDLLGLLVGSEGTFGIVTKIWVRLTPSPEEVRTMLAPFQEMVDAGNAVSDIIAAGILPAALEILDQMTIGLIEQSVHKAGYPRDAGAVLLVELDGLRAGMDAQQERVEAILARNGAINVRVARDAHERKSLWAGRKNAFGVAGRISTDIYVQDGVVPRSKLPEVLRELAGLGKKHGFTVYNVFHAGDGNIHPLIAYDGRDPAQVKRVLAIGEEILKLCVRVGGAISGEHGIGVEKKDFMPLVFSEDDLRRMADVKAVFNPSLLLNPKKVFPTHPCVEVRHAFGGGAAAARR